MIFDGKLYKIPIFFRYIDKEERMKWFNWFCLVGFLLSVVGAVFLGQVPWVKALLTLIGIFDGIFLSGWFSYLSLRLLKKNFPKKFEWWVVKGLYIFISFSIFYSFFMSFYQWLIGIKIY